LRSSFAVLEAEERAAAAASAAIGKPSPTWRPSASRPIGGRWCG